MGRWPDRKRPSTDHVKHVDGRPDILFVTVCTWERQGVLLGRAEHAALVSAWSQATAWLVGRYVVMPDHVHFFCEPQSEHDFDNWMAYWKRLSTKAWPRVVSPRIWEYDGWDTQIRSASDYDDKWRYVLENPVRKGLVARHEDWPYSGEVHRLSW